MKVIRESSVRHAYSYDATGSVCIPEGVVFPIDTEEVKEAVIHCRTKKIPLIPRGAGTGFVGGSIPVEGGIVLSTEKMKKILDIDTKNMVALVEPGVITAELQRAAEKFGLTYPPDPSSLESCTIGGNVATNAGGPKAVKYGVTGDYVAGLQVVLGTGEIYEELERVRKKVVGLNLVPLFVGSEGTLGVITKVLLKLVPKPEAKSTILIVFRSLEKAGEAVVELLRIRHLPSALEIMDTTSITCVKKYGKIDLPQKTEAVLLAEAEGTERETKDTVKKIKEIARRFKAQVKIAQTEEESQRIWRIRRAISPSLMNIAPTKINEDITVPVSKLAEALSGFKKISEKYGIPIVSFGHAGDGNIHVNIMTDREDPKLWERALQATKEVFLLTVSLGGVLSGEHGIGLSKKPYLGIQLPPHQRIIYRRIKNSLDPDNILNPGKKL